MDDIDEVEDEPEPQSREMFSRKLRFQDTRTVGWQIIRYLLEFEVSDGWTHIHLALIVVNYWLSSCCYVFHRTNTASFFPFIVACDVTYIIDLVFAIAVKFSRKMKIHLERPPRSIWSLGLDGFLALPIPNIMEIAGYSTNSVTFVFLRANTLLRLHRVQVYLHDKNHQAGANHWKYFIIYFLTVLFLLHHTGACGWFLACCPLGQTDVNHGWVKNEVIFKDIYGTDWNWYIICLYFALLTSSFADFGDLVPSTHSERFLTLFNMTVGFVLIKGIFIGVLSALFVNYYKRIAYLRMQLITIKKFITDIRLPEKYCKVIMEYYKILWTKKSGVDQPTDWSPLPYALVREISFDINIKGLKCSMLFRDKPEAFLRTVAAIMTHEFLQPGEMIFYHNVLKRRMVFIVLGSVDVLSDEDNQSPIITFGPGTCLGETSLIMSLPSKASVRAATYVELNVLYRRDFINTIMLYPQIYEGMYQEITARIDMAEEFHDEAQLQKAAVEMNFYRTKFDKPTIIKRLKDKLTDRIPLKTVQDKFLKMYTISRQTTHERRDALCLNEKFPWIIYPNTSLYWFWEIVMLANATFVGISFPYYIAFQGAFPRWLNDLSLYTDLLMIFDLLVMVSTAVEKGNVLITTYRGILNERLKQVGFYLDICSCILIEMFYYPFSTTKDSHLYFVLKLNRVLKTYRICYFFWCVEHMLHVPIFAIRLIKFPIYLLITSYWYGTIMYLITCFDPICNEKGWFYKKLLEDVKNQLEFPCTDHHVLMSLYFSIVVMSGVAYGDIVPYSMEDTLMVYCGVVIGMLMFGYCTAELSATITHILKPRTDFQGTFISVMTYLNERKISPRVLNRVYEFFEAQWHYDKGFRLSGQSLFYNASEEITIECSVTEKYDLLTRIPLFRQMNPDFLSSVGAVARTILMPPNEVVYYENEYVRNVYVIQSGFCIRTTGNVTAIMPANTYFGALQLFNDIRGSSTIRTLTHVKLLCITEENFWRVGSIFPKDRLLFLDASQKIETAKYYEILSELRTATRTSYEKPPYKITGSFVNVVKYCREHDEDYGEPFRKLNLFFWVKYLLMPFCLVPHGLFLKLWVGLRILSALTTAVLVPYVMIQAPYEGYLDVVLSCLDNVAYIDLYIMLFVGYYRSEQQLVLHPLRTAAHYLQGKFILDLLFCLPLDTIFKDATGWTAVDYRREHYRKTIHYWYCILKLLRLGQTYRLAQLMDYFQENIASRRTFFQILKFLPITVIFLNTCAGILVVHTCFYIQTEDISPNIIVNGTATHDDMAERPVGETAGVMFCDVHSWFDRSYYRNWTQPYEVFLVAIYFCTTTLTRCGTHQLTPYYESRLIITIIIIICGVLFFGYVFASITSAQADWNTALSVNQEMIKELKTFMVAEEVPKTMQNYIIAGFEYRWKRSRGAEAHKVMSNFHPALVEDVFLNMYGKTLKEVPLFSSMDAFFFRIMGKELEEKFFYRKEIIQREEDIVSTICIIFRGQVEITSPNEPYTTMGPGGIFGNLSPHSQIKVSVTITAVSNVDILEMNSQDFHGLFRRYPAMKERLAHIMRKNLDFIQPAFEKVDTEDDHTSVFPEEFDIGVASDLVSRSSTITLEAEPQDEQENNLKPAYYLCFPWSICRISVAPDTPFVICLEYVTLVLTYLNSVFTLYRFSFQNHESEILMVDAIFDAFFFFKIFIDLHTAYENRFGELVTTNKLIIQRFFYKRKFRRCLDIAVNIPFYYMILLSATIVTWRETMLYFSCVRLVTLWRFVYFIDWYKHRSNTLMVNQLYLSICYTIVTCTTILHICSCIWYLFACPFTWCLDYSWMTELPDGPSIVQDQTRKKYILCLYAMMGIFVGSGMAGIIPVTKAEQVYLIFVMVMANFVTALFISQIVNVMNRACATRVNYEYIIEEIKLYLKNGHVSDFQLDKLWNYLQHLWIVCRGRQTPRLLSSLHSVASCDLMFEIYGHHLTNSYIFGGCEVAFLRQLTNYFRVTTFFPGNYIVQHGDSNEAMYFIHYGNIEILTVHSNLTESVHELLEIGDMFGLVQGLYHGITHHFSFRAKTTARVVSLRLTNWEGLLEYFPKSKELIYNKAADIFNNM